MHCVCWVVLKKVPWPCCHRAGPWCTRDAWATYNGKRLCFVWQDKYPDQLSATRGPGVFKAVDARDGVHRDKIVTALRNKGHVNFALIWITCMAHWLIQTSAYYFSHKVYLWRPIVFSTGCSIHLYVHIYIRTSLFQSRTLKGVDGFQPHE